MAADEQLLFHLAESVLDGRPVDWTEAESNASESQRALVAHLKSVAGIASFHLHSTLSDADASHGSGVQLASSHPVAWGPLTIIERIGQGSFGDVYRAHDAKLDRVVALKLLRRPDRGGDAVESAVIEEGRLMARVRHPNVISVFGAARIEGQVGLWTEFVRGRTLEAILRSDGPFGAHEATLIGLDLCRALSAVHGAGLIHRDVKTQNVMREAGGRIVLMDFGTGRDDLTDRPAELAGTPLYLAPEVFGGAPATARSDIYSLGVLLFHLVTASYPVSGRTAADIRSAHAERRRVWLRDVRADLPDTFVQVVERALAMESDDRYESGGAMEAALARVLASEQPHPASDRLESWKDIAAHLRRDVRTVQRWEQTDGLPVHPFRRAHRAIPYAYRSELDAWWTGRSSTTTVRQELDSSPATDGRRQRTRAIALATAAMVVLLAGATAYWMARPRVSRVLPLEERTWVLVANFENHSGDSALDEVVEDALERNLSQSPTLAIVTRTRVNDALRLMRRPPETKLDAATAAQVCARDEAVAALVTGRLERVSGSYVVTANLSAPCSSAPMAVLEERTATREGVDAAVARLSDRLRTDLGKQGSASRATNRLAHVTTRSLTALRLFSQADALIVQREDAGAETLLREAIAEDPDFASAHTWLAWAMRHLRRSPVEVLTAAARAEQLSSTTTETERLFIHGSALDLAGHAKEACAVYRALIGMQPDHYWAVHNALGCAFDEVDRTGTADFEGKLADVRPNDIDVNVGAAWANEYLISNPTQAKRYLDRAEQLQRDGQYSHWGYADTWLRLRPAYQKWLEDDVDGALTALIAITRDAGRFEPEPREDLFTWAGDFMLTLGRVDDAERLFKQIAGDNVRAGYLAEAAYARGDRKHARQHELLYSDPGPMAAIISARIGLFDIGRATLAGGRATPGTWDAEAIRGELAFQSADLAGAVEHLSAAVRRPHGRPHYFLAAETLAEALTRSGRLDDAIETLEIAATERQHAYDPGYGGTVSGYAWLRVRVLQAELYARRSRTADSARVAHEVVRLLRRADPNFPLLQRATQLLNDDSATSRRRNGVGSRAMK